eukprot:Rhum_TRINITY_DN3076_c0_g1::Rhum_TRINITY_DN3076_c0_g1_i1::g.9156::m.9156
MRYSFSFSLLPLSSLANSSAESLDRHLKGTLVRVVSTDEARRVDEHAPRDTRRLAKGLVAQSLPRQRLPAVESGALHTHSAHPPPLVHVREQAVQHLAGHVLRALHVEEVLLPRAEGVEADDLAALVHVEPLLQRLAHDVRRRQPRVREERHALLELEARQGHRLHKSLVEGLGVRLLVPARRQVADAGAERRRDAVVLHDGDAGVGGGVLLHAVVDAVDVLHEVLVDLVVQALQVGVRDVGGSLPEHLAAVVQVHKTGARQARLVLLDARVHRLLELLLVVVKEVVLRLVAGTNVHHNVALGEQVRVPRTHDDGVLELVGHLQHGNGQGLIAVEGAVVRADDHLRGVRQRVGDEKRHVSDESLSSP